MHWYKQAMKKFADFSGRARRKEYWMFTLVNYAILMILALLEIALLPEPTFLPAILYVLVAAVPTLAVTVRRLHDIGNSGWWILINLVPYVGGIALLVMTLMNSQPGTNEYGPNPKEPDYDPVEVFT